MTGRIPHHLELILLRRDCDTNPWIRVEAGREGVAPGAEEMGGFLSGAAFTDKRRQAPVRYERVARFSSTAYGLLDRDPFQAGQIIRDPTRNASPATGTTLAPPLLFEDRLRIEVARGHTVSVARIRVEGLDQHEALRDVALDHLAGYIGERVCPLAGPANVTSIGTGEFFVRVPRGSRSAALFRAALCGMFAPIPSIGTLPGLRVSVGMAQSPRDGVTLAGLGLAAEGRMQIYRPRDAIDGPAVEGAGAASIDAVTASTDINAGVRVGVDAETSFTTPA